MSVYLNLTHALNCSANNGRYTIRLFNIIILGRVEVPISLEAFTAVVVSTKVISFHFSHFPTIKHVSKGLVSIKKVPVEKESSHSKFSLISEIKCSHKESYAQL